MNKNTRNGLIALGALAFAYWKYKMTPEQKQNLKDKVAGIGKKIKENVPQEIKNTMSKTVEQSA